MSPFVSRAVSAAALAVLAGCASGATSSRGAASASGIPPETPARATAPPPSEPPAATSSATTAITGGTVSTTEAAPASGWTDAQIVAVLVAAADGDAQEAAAVRERSHAARVNRFAEHMQTDDRVLGDRVRALAARLGSGDSASRLEVDVERAGYLVALRDAPDEKVDAVFLRGQAVQCATLVHMIDDELLGAARDPELVALVRELRASAAHHLETVQDIQARRGR